MTVRRRLLVALAVTAWPAIAAAQHVGHQHPPATAPAAATPAPPDGHDQPLPTSATTPVPPLTDADRIGAAADVHGHAVHDEAVHTYLLFDRFEWQSGRGGDGVHWDAKGWIGRDRDRLWLRSEGSTGGGHLEAGSVHALYGRAISPWWDVVVGLRQDVRPGPAQTWLAVGVQGLAPQWFEVEASAYVGAGGRIHLRFEAEQEILVTNRLVLQPLVDAELSGKDDTDHGLGAGLSSAGAGLRLRYEIRREVAPYVGVSWRRTFFGTADAAREAGQPVSGVRAVIGLRFWM